MPIDPKKLVFPKEKYATGWQDTGIWDSLNQFAAAAGMDPKSITRLQKREKPVSLRVMTKYANALGLEVSDVISPDTRDAANRSHRKIDKTSEWLYAPYRDFGWHMPGFEESIVDVALRPYTAHEILDASNNLTYDGRNWLEAVNIEPIWILDSDVRSGSDSLAKNIEALSTNLESSEKLDVGNERRNSLSLIATNLTAAASIETILANLKRQNDVHVLGGQISTFIFDYEKYVHHKHWVQITYPIFLITGLGNVTASVAVKALVKDADQLNKEHVGGPEQKDDSHEGRKYDIPDPAYADEVPFDISDEENDIPF